MTRNTPRLRIVLTTAIAALVLILVLVPSAIGGRGGQSTSPSATLTSDCNPCALGTIAHFSGSGYDPSEPRGMAAITDAAGNTNWIGINISSNGTTSFELYMSPTGTYNIKVLQNLHKKLVLRAELAGLVVQ